ncbi:MAG: hypothetical protein ACLFPF_05420 [Halanaerobiales bacterium]
MSKRMIRHILDKGINCLAIIGMAKNSGKTVAFNTIVREGTTYGLKLALVSYGRDGEDIDSLTLKKKPRIKVSTGNIFVTAERVFRAANVEAKLISTTDFHTPFGKINIYRARGKGNVELIGVNTINQLQRVKEQLPADIGLVIIDGALDRRSSAIPELAGGIVLSTGAVIANTEEKIVEKTIHEIRRVSIPGVYESAIRDMLKKPDQQGRNAVITSQGKVFSLKSSTSFSVNKLSGQLSSISNKINVLFLKGALVNSFAEELINRLGLNNCRIIVRNGTRIFLDKSVFNLLEKYNVRLRVLNEIKVIGITVNPVSPYGLKVDSSKLINKLRKRIDNIPIYDLMSDEYLSLPAR